MVRPGDIRRVPSFNIRTGSSTQSGFRSALNEQGELVFRTSFNSGQLGTAIFKINLDDRNLADGNIPFGASSIVLATTLLPDFEVQNRDFVSSTAPAKLCQTKTQIRKTPDRVSDGINPGGVAKVGTKKPASTKRPVPK
ncbi:MAG: hypothetical protein ACON4R_03590 [Akkermansiaceae bacterium]